MLIYDSAELICGKNRAALGLLPALREALDGVAEEFWAAEDIRLEFLQARREAKSARLRASREAETPDEREARRAREYADEASRRERARLPYSDYLRLP